MTRSMFVAVILCVAASLSDVGVSGQQHPPTLPNGSAEDHSGSCSQSCGQGVVAKTVCGEGQMGACTHVMEPCNPRPCDNYEFLLSHCRWSTCSKSCGGGTQTRTLPNGKTEMRKCNTFPCESIETRCCADVLLVLDNSGSMSGHWNDAIDFARDFVNSLPISSTSTRVGVIMFNSNAAVEISFSDDKASLLAEISGLSISSGATNIVSAVNKMYDYFESSARENVRKVAVFITDGEHNTPTYPDNLQAIKDAILLAHQADILTIAIGAGVSVSNPQFVKQVKALSSGDDYFFLETAMSDISNRLDKIVEYTCSDVCARCNYTNGQIWLQYTPNCHQYIVCEPLGHGNYRKHLMTCGHLYWNQALHTCTEERTGTCCDGDVVPYTGPTSSPPGECPYKTNPYDPRFFCSKANPGAEQQFCKPGMVFSEEACTCVVCGPVEPTCSDDLLLHFKFDEDFIDSTCHNAVADVYGSVTLVNDCCRNMVARFDGKSHLEVMFMRTWFANNHVDKFSVSLWYKKTGASSSSCGALVNNADCKQDAGFSLRATANTMYGEIFADNQRLTTGSITSSLCDWHHAVWVYDGAKLTVYVDKVVVSTSSSVTGYLQNNDVPMMIGAYCDKYFFEGLMDELRVYNRVLSAADIAYLNQLPCS